MSVLEVRELSKSYKVKNGHIKALDNISLKVRKGSIFGFIGPNGAGKSTTIGIILQFLYQDSGDVLLFDEIVNKTNIKSLKKKIGFIPDADLPAISGYQIIKQTARISGYKGSEMRNHLKNIIQLTGTKDILGRNTKKLSKGQKTKIKIANALIGNKELIIADEPTSGLDPLARRQFLNLIQNLAKEGVTVFFSNHVIGEIEKICSEVSIISKGKIAVNGSINEIVKSIPHSNSYNLSIEGVSLKILSTLSGIESIEQRFPGDYIVKTKNGFSENPEFLKELISKPGVTIHSFSKTNVALEDIFFSVVQEVQ